MRRRELRLGSSVRRLGAAIGLNSVLTATPASILGASLIADYSAVAGNLYTDAALTAAVVNDADGVKGWKDSSSNAYNATMAGTGAAYKVSILNGLPVVRFNGTTAGLKASVPNTAQPLTMFLVCQITASQYLVDSNDNAHRNAIGQDIIAAGLGAFAGGTGCTAALTVPTAGFDFWEVDFNGVSSAILRNGSAFAAGDAGAQTLTGLTIGASNGGVAPATFDLARLVLCSAPTAAQVTAIKTLFASTYGLTIA